MTGIVVSGIVFPGSGQGQVAATGISKLEHIVMQENRSFDHYFGTFPGAAGFPLDEDGEIDVCIPNPCDETPANGSCIKPFHDPRERNVGGPHSYVAHVTAVNDGKMDGLVQAFKDASKPCDPRRAMSTPGAGAAGPAWIRQRHGVQGRNRHPELLDLMSGRGRIRGRRSVNPVADHRMARSRNARTPGCRSTG